MERIGETRSILLFSAGSYRRLAVPVLGAILALKRSKLTGGARGRQFRRSVPGPYPPLIPLHSVLHGTQPDAALNRNLLQVVVLHQGRWEAGLIVDGVIDIVETQATFEKQWMKPGILGPPLSTANWPICSMSNMCSGPLRSGFRSRAGTPTRVRRGCGR